MSNTLYRPLIRLAKKTQQNVYLPCQCYYSLSEISIIKKHLPKTLVFVGVDAEQFSEDEKRILEQEKLKLKSVDGKSIVDDSQIKFYKHNQLEMKEWSDVYVCIDVPCNPKQSSELAKEDLDNQIESYLNQYLWLRNKQNQSMIQGAQNVKLSSVQVILEACQLSTRSFDKQYKQLRLKVPLAVIINKKQGINGTSLKEKIKNDIMNCLKIMIKNELPLRVIEPRSNIILQSFVAKETDQQAQKIKLKGMLDIEKPKIQQIAKEPTEQNAKKDPSNRTLMMVLIALATIYIFLKMYPLKSTLQL